MGADLEMRESVRMRHIQVLRCSLLREASSPDFRRVEWHSRICSQALSIPVCSTAEMAITLGVQEPVFGRSSFRADVYSIWARLAAFTRSPSALFTTTKSTSSTMPFFSPYK